MTNYEEPEVIAMGSASELQNHMSLAKDLGFLSESNHAALAKALISVRQMLTAFFQTLRITRNTPPPANREWRGAE